METIKLKSFRHFIVVCIVLALAACNTPASKTPNLAPTPPMGWNSWNTIDKANIMPIVERIPATDTEAEWLAALKWCHEHLE